MTALLALVAVVAFMAKAGLPWWVVAAVALLMAGFAAGRSWSPGKGARNPASSAPAGQPVWSSVDRRPTVPPVPVDVRVTCPDESAQPPALVTCPDESAQPPAHAGR